MRRTFTLLLTWAAVIPAAEARAQSLALVSFRKDVAPILLQRCQSCHGPRRSSGGLRVDSYARLMGKSSGGPVIVPGNARESELYRLLVTTDKDERMPKSTTPLPAAEIEAIGKWIAQGAKFDGPDATAELAAVVPPPTHPAPPKVYRAPVPILSLAFSPDGKELAASGYHEVTIWDPATGKLLRRIGNVGQRTQGLRYSPDGSLLVVASGSPGEYGELKTFEPKSGRLVHPFATSTDIVLDVAFSPDGSLVASAGTDRTVRVYEVAAGKEIARIKQHADWVTAVAFSRDGASVVAASYDRMVKVYNARSGKLEANYGGHKAKVLTAAFDPDSGKVCSAGEDHKLHLWDPKEIAAQDGTAAQMEDRFKKALPVKHVAGFSADVLRVIVQGKQIYSTSADGLVRQHDFGTLQPVRTYTGLGDWAYALALHPQSGQLAAGCFNGEVWVWDAHDGRLVTSFLAAPGLSKRH